MRFPCIPLAQNFRRLLYGQCHHFCPLEESSRPLPPPWVCHHGLEQESGKQHSKQRRQREFTCSLCLAGAPGTQQRGLHRKLFLFAPGMLFWVWSQKGTVSLIVLLVSQSASQHLLFRVLRQMLPAHHLALLVTSSGRDRDVCLLHLMQNWNLFL